MTLPELRKRAADKGIRETGSYIEWLETRLLSHETAMEGRTPPPEWPQWDREQYAELCENAEAWLQGSPHKLPWSIETRVSPATQVLIKNSEGQFVVWHGMDNGSYTSAATAEYILRAINVFPMALWATIQHNNDAAAYWSLAQNTMNESSHMDESAKAAKAALRRIVQAARKAEIDHSTVFTVDDGAISAALDVLSQTKEKL